MIHERKLLPLQFSPGLAILQGNTDGRLNDKSQFEEERLQVDQARLALVEEKARIAKALEQQGERLQQEVFSIYAP